MLTCNSLVVEAHSILKSNAWNVMINPTGVTILVIVYYNVQKPGLTITVLNVLVKTVLLITILDIVVLMTTCLMRTDSAVVNTNMKKELKLVLMLNVFVKVLILETLMVPVVVQKVYLLMTTLVVNVTHSCKLIGLMNLELSTVLVMKVTKHSTGVLSVIMLIPILVILNVSMS